VKNVTGELRATLDYAGTSARRHDPSQMRQDARTVRENASGLHQDFQAIAHRLGKVDGDSFGDSLDGPRKAVQHLVGGLKELSGPAHSAVAGQFPLLTAAQRPGTTQTSATSTPRTRTAARAMLEAEGRRPGFMPTMDWGKGTSGFAPPSVTATPAAAGGPSRSHLQLPDIRGKTPQAQAQNPASAQQHRQIRQAVGPG
jgi:hypothetical protein